MSVRMILTAFPQKDAEVVLLKTGKLTHQFYREMRLIVTEAPEEFATLPVGELPAQTQDIANDLALRPFFSHHEVIKAAGSEKALELWVDKIPNCQWKRDHHDRNLKTVEHENGAVRLCWRCDNLHSTQFHPSLGDIAETNRAEWLTEAIRSSLGFNEGHQLTLPELCWWATRKHLTHLLPNDIDYRVTNTPKPPALKGVMKEADINPWQTDPAKVIADSVELIKPAFKLVEDKSPPASFMLKPKAIRLELPEYLQWVKTQPCCSCGQQADDPHHIINNGFGGMGTKANDLLVIPLCRICHGELHRDVKAWERKHGSQLLWVLKTQNKAAGLGVIARA